MRPAVFMTAGIVGGLAEVLWVSLYSSLTSLHGTEVARAVAASVFPAAASTPAAPLIGLAIHLALSLALGIGAGTALSFTRRRHDLVETLALCIGALALVWAVNFLVILPRLNPGFTALMPYPVTLLSKLAFGAAMACVLHAANGRKAKSGQRRASGLQVV